MAPNRIRITKGQNSRIRDGAIPVVASLLNANRLGAKLAEIESADENNFLRLHAFEINPEGHFWVGGTDVLVDGQWIWISSQEKVQYTDWVPGEPNGGTREGCLMLNGGKFHFHWNDANCHSLQFFICEKLLDFGGSPSVIG